MQFQSTRDPNTIVSSSEAILRGLAPDGGLFVPTAFPKAELEDWKSLSYPELAQKVLAGFLTDYDPAFLGEAAAATYGDAFAGKAGYVQKVHDGLYSLELWHGPTCAFKDYALQLMPKLLVQAKKTWAAPKRPAFWWQPLAIPARLHWLVMQACRALRLKCSIPMPVPAKSNACRWPPRQEITYPSMP